MPLPYVETPAFKLGDAHFRTEREAIIAAINEALAAAPPATLPTAADRVFAKADELLPLLARAVEVTRMDRQPPAGHQLSRDGFDTTPRAQRWSPAMDARPRHSGFVETAPGAHRLPPFVPMEELESELAVLELVAPPYKPSISGRVYSFLRAWVSLDRAKLTPDFQRRALVILGHDGEACVNVPGYIAAAPRAGDDR